MNGLLLWDVDCKEVQYIGNLLNVLAVVAMTVLTGDSAVVSGLCKK
jgi:hypothetical protein